MSRLFFLLSTPKALAHYSEPLSPQDSLLVCFSVAFLNLDKPPETHSFQCLSWRDHMFICTVLQLALVLFFALPLSITFSSKSGCRSPLQGPRPQVLHHLCLSHRGTVQENRNQAGGS